MFDMFALSKTLDAAGPMLKELPATLKMWSDAIVALLHASDEQKALLREIRDTTYQIKAAVSPGDIPPTLAIEHMAMAAADPRNASAGNDGHALFLDPQVTKHGEPS